MTDTAKSASAAVAQLQSQLGLQTGGSPQEGQRAMSLSNCTCTCFSSLGMWCLESKVSFFSNLWWLEPLLLVCLNQKIPKSSHVRLCPCLTSLPLMHRRFLQVPLLDEDLSEFGDSPSPVHNHPSFLELHQQLLLLHVPWRRKERGHPVSSTANPGRPCKLEVSA